MEEQNDISCNHGALKAAERPTLWMVAVPRVSHVNCFFRFALELARHGLTVTLFTIDEQTQRVQASEGGMLLDKSRREGLNVRLLPCWVMSNAGDKDSSYDTRERRIARILSAAEEALVKFIRSEYECARKPTCFISDLWFKTSREVAIQCGIPAWVMSPYSSGYLSLITYVYELESKGILSMPDSPNEVKTRDELISIPGLPLLRIGDIPYFYFRSHPVYPYAKQNAESLQKCDVILLSSFYELESKSFREFQRLMKALAIKTGRKIPHIWHVGPTVDFLACSSGSKVDAVADEGKHSGIEFLDSQAASSVVLLTFGTLVHHSQEQIEEIARGLEYSNRPFVCVLNAPVLASGVQGDDIFSVIPADCVERTRGRGLFIQGWVPQMKLLAHPATGGFVSHCGHNSILESLILGVPILAWPCTSDQFLNCRFLVEEAEVAMEVCKGRGGFVDRKEVERSVRALFHSEEGIVVRKKAQQMRESAIKTVGENGNTTKNIESLVTLIRAVHRTHEAGTWSRGPFERVRKSCSSFSTQQSSTLSLGHVWWTKQ